MQGGPAVLVRGIRVRAVRVQELQRDAIAAEAAAGGVQGGAAVATPEVHGAERRPSAEVIGGREEPALRSQVQ